MNLELFFLYFMAAIMLIVVMVKTYKEHEAMGRSLLVASFCAVCIIFGYSINFITNNYTLMSVGISIEIAFQDFLMLALFDYCIDFTRFRKRSLTVLETIFLILCILDAVTMFFNIFNEKVLQYSVNIVENTYVLGYEPTIWFMIHTIINGIMLGSIISVLVIKCIRIPSVYWGRYTILIFGGLVVLFFKYMFISDYFDVRFDFSILIYVLLGILLYWNTFWYSRKNMLNITHTMIIDHMRVAVILFDYQGEVADFNEALSNIFPDITYDNRSQTIEWFKTDKHCDELLKKDIFNWEINGKVYECRTHKLTSSKKRFLGTILVMYDISDLTKAYNDLERSYTFDALTNLYNKYTLKKKYEKDKYKILCVCNINNLSGINEKYGQETGDRCLIGLANIICEKVGDMSLVARLDGSDIVCLLSMEEIYALELMTDIKDTVFKRLSKDDLKVTIEFGEVVIDDGESIDDNINDAIKAMRSKKILSENSVRKSLVGSLTQGLNEYDMQTDKQIERERELCGQFADKLGLNDILKTQLVMVATLHDIGKVAIPNTILLKNGELDEDEREIMKTHTEKGYRIAKAATELEPIALSILCHHERYDGSGYPNGLMGEDIPLLSRIFMIVDAYDAMTHDRPYRKTKTNEEAIEELKRCSGTQFDPALVNVFVELVE